MIRRRNIILLVLTIPTFLLGQLKPVFISKHYSTEYDCNYFADINKPKSDLERQRRIIHCIANNHRDISRALSMLDSLNSIYESDDLLHDKIRYLAFYRPFDTIYFSLQRQLIAKNYSVAYSYAMLGTYYMNYVAICSTDSSSIRLSNENKIKLLEHSKYSFERSFSGRPWVKGYSIVYYPDVLKELQSLKGIKLNKLFKSKASDSITIIADIPDCGEFGRHFEYIKFYRKNDSLSVHFMHDSARCQTGFFPDRPIYIPANQGKLIKENILSHKFFKSIDTSKQKRGSNAPLNIYVYLDNKFYEFSEWDGKSTNRDEYEAFKNDIFK